MNEKYVKLILDNLNIIEQNREIIESNDLIRFNFDCAPLTLNNTLNLTGLNPTTRKDIFVLDNGLCHNASLYCIDYIYSHNTISLDKLACIWLKITDQDETAVTVNYPIRNDKEYKTNLWRNPERWEYLRFVRYQLNYLLINNKFDKTVKHEKFI